MFDGVFSTYRGDIHPDIHPKRVELMMAPIVPTDREVENGTIELKYSCVKDRYVRVSDDGKVIDGWKSLVDEEDSVFRKEEHDWKTVYLSCKEGKQSGKLVWKFDLTSKNVCIDIVEIKVESTCFRNGSVRWTLKVPGGEPVEVSQGRQNIFEEFAKCTQLLLSAQLTCGTEGRCTWQNAQLFRQSFSDSTGYPLTIILLLRKK